MIDEYGIERRPEHSELPGSPRGKLVREVRKVLWRYLRCRPHRDDACWRLTWEWAEACTRRDELFRFGKQRRRPWPSATEIASQYLLLVLAEMRESRALRLPWRAAECVPDNVKRRFGLTIGHSAKVAMIEHSGSAPTTAGERPDLTT